MEYDMSFLKQRFFKLSVTYYPFLILMFAFLYFVDDYHFNVKNVLSHVCYLAWFDKLPNFGHLYYMTMIAICYVALYILTKIPLFNTINKYRLKTFAIIGLGVLLVDYVLESRNIPGYILCGCGFIYFALSTHAELWNLVDSAKRIFLLL